MGANCCSPVSSTLRAVKLVESVDPLKQELRLHPDVSKMIKIPAGPFLMGTNSALAYPADGEGPQRNVEVDEFWIDETTVTNLNFSKFVEASGYQTEAELSGWSFVPAFLVPKQDEKFLMGTPASTPWWAGIKGANWRHPLGPSSSFLEMLDHPVVHLSWEDATAYAHWLGKRLPTEAEWEKAARGGSKQTIFPWGNEVRLNKEFTCNIWQGDFPESNTGEDGFLGTAPVYEYKPNGYGLFNVCGNVWEWCSDNWGDNSQFRNVNQHKIINPQGPASGEDKVIKGGSFMCHDSYCNRYRISARSSHPKNGFTAHIGFRCVNNQNRELLSSL